MIKCAFGAGGSEDARQCVSEAVKDFKDPKMIIFFSNEKHFREYAKIIHEMFPNAVSMGCSGYRMWDAFGSDKDMLKAAALEDGVVCSAGVIERADSFALNYMDTVKSCLENVGETKNTVCVEFTVPFKRAEEYALMALNSVLLRKGVPVIGGSAGNTRAGKYSFQEAYVALNGQIYTAGCVFAIIHNLNGRILLYKENIYEPLTGREFTVTKANSITRTVMTYNDEPAAEVYSREINVPIDGISEYFFDFPIGQRFGEETYITAIQEKGSNGSMKHLARINEGTKIMVMKEGDYKNVNARTIEDIKREIPKPSFMLMFHCVAITLLYEAKDYVDEYEKLLSEAFPDFIGFSCLGEQIETKHFNHTMLAAVFE